MDEKQKANPGYALGQIAKAIQTGQTHPDGSVRERAMERIASWLQVLSGMVSGKIEVGSRTPLASVPGWATPQVVQGGFATGELLAGGPLRPHEEALLAATGARDRKALNHYYLTERGFADLAAMLRTGRYAIEVPEEGALLAVAWLVKEGHGEEATALVAELAPFFETLRFYPIPSQAPQSASANLCLQEVGQTIESLRRIKPNEQILRQRATVQTFIPLYDQMVALLLETVDGEPPTTNGPWIAGGWPCQRYPDGWADRARALLAEIDAARQGESHPTGQRRPGGQFTNLQAYLHRIVDEPGRLTGRDVGWIRCYLAGYVSKYGRPGGKRWAAFRARQRESARAVSTHEIAAVVVERLKGYPRESGIEDLAPVARPLTAAEAERWGIDAADELPRSVLRKVRRSLAAPIPELVAQGLITASETLAILLPQITAGVRGAGLIDEEARRLYAAIYRAFRRRRSLLLLNLESQIRLAELPWVAALDRHRADDLSAQEVARQTFRETATLAITAFPEAIIPNKLLQEFYALAKGAGLDLPLVNELATDIFMGQFGPKFLRAAKQAGDLLESSLYATYYGIDYDQIRQLPVSEERGRPDPFALLCAERAGVPLGAWRPATNGMIIEQQQILTTQNLAVLYASLGLQETVGSQAAELARRCFIWVCRRQQMKIDGWHGRLIMMKQTAYAWRQMLFFLSLLPAAAVQGFIGWAEVHLNRQEAGFQSRFRPALLGLWLAAKGDSPESAGGRRFLGWSNGKHWLVGE